MTTRDGYLADLAQGAVLAVDPKRGVEMFESAERAVQWMARGGLDYFVTVTNSDTGDEVERWIPLHDPRWEGEP